MLFQHVVTAYWISVIICSLQLIGPMRDVADEALDRRFIASIVTVMLIEASAGIIQFGSPGLWSVPAVIIGFFTPWFLAWTCFSISLLAAYRLDKTHVSFTRN